MDFIWLLLLVCVVWWFVIARRTQSFFRATSGGTRLPLPLVKGGSIGRVDFGGDHRAESLTGRSAMASGWGVGWDFEQVGGAGSGIDAARFLQAGPSLAAL